MPSIFLHSIFTTSRMSVALPQFVPAPRVLLPATWGRHGHMLPFMNWSATAGPQPLLRLIHSPQSLGSCTIPWALSLLLLVSIPPFIPPLPPTPALLKSAAIKTDAGLKCHKCISNCQNINLFTLRCLAFSHSGGGWVKKGWVLKGLE